MTEYPYVDAFGVEEARAWLLGEAFAEDLQDNLMYTICVQGPSCPIDGSMDIPF